MANLENAPAGAASRDICQRTPLTIDAASLRAKLCRPICNIMRGEFEHADKTCTAVASNPVRRALDRVRGCANLQALAVKALARWTRQFRKGKRLRALSDADLRKAADQCGFRSMTISLVGDLSVLVGGNVSPGIAMGVLDCSKPRWIVSAGWSIGPVSGANVSADFSLQVGFWEATVDGLAGKLKIATLGAHDVVGGDVSVLFNKKGFEGIVFGLGTGAGVEVEGGEVITQYVDAIPELAKHFLKDVGKVITLGQTKKGADLGRPCRVGADCKGYGLPVGPHGAVACCRHRCVRTKRDWAGIWWCPHRCKKHPVAKLGSCR
jgi:hypothetical protein